MEKSFFSRPVSMILALIIVLAGSFLAYSVQTDFGNVKVKEIRFAGDYGQILSAKLFIPKDFNPEKKYPAVLTMHGYINSKEVQDPFNIEYARRGYVVLSVDMQGHGYSEQVPYEITTRGALSALSYLHNLPFVDQKRIAVEGHSMGGWSTLAAAGLKPEWVNTVIQVGSSTETYGSAEVTATTPFNYAIIFSKYDEFAKLMWEVPQAKQIVDSPKLKKVFGVEGTVEPNKLYGSFENHTARMLYMPPVIHPGDHWSKEAIGDTIEFLQLAIPAPNPINPSNQIWRLKEYGTFIAMIGALMFLFAFAGNLLNTRYFSVIAERIPEAKGYKTKAAWISAAVISSAIPAITYFKFQEWGQKWFPVNSFWPQSLTNGFVVWVLFNALIGIILFAAWHFISNKKEGATSYNYGISYATDGLLFDLQKLGISGIFAILIVGAFYMLTVIVHEIFLIDLRIWVMAFKPMDWSRFVIGLKYLIPFLAFFLVNGALLHGQLRMKESDSDVKTAWKWFFGSVAVNIGGILVLIIIKYYPLFTKETFDVTKALLSIVAFQFLFINFLTATISTYFFRKTGKIYTGAFVNALLVTWYIVSGQAIQYAGQKVSAVKSFTVTILLLLVFIVLLVVKGKKQVAIANRDV